MQCAARDSRFESRFGAADQRELYVQRGHRRPAQRQRGAPMIVLGVILLLVGFIAKISILWTIGIVLVVIGLVLVLLGRTGRPVGGRAHYF
ncbi:DUF6131 family protein [Antrihabitans sp. YC2-6]|uniref:DUF6131 family protein n=1 Tax=Antrihabitans sp. YC2-6 TaxID=2799498 RepID=UPI0018F57246|nr:DUF6131 family protein [Antrihabitans sp. YC2-6]MBJ8347124.1 DUF3040 domain-containing protein [Antrihabitans sp. YC2-6]